jgi:hypothetical protein
MAYLGFEKGDMDSFSISYLSLAFFLLRVAASSRPRVTLFVGLLLSYRAGTFFQALRSPKLNLQIFYQLPQVLFGVLQTVVDNGQILCGITLAANPFVGRLLNVADINHGRIAKISK